MAKTSDPSGSGILPHTMKSADDSVDADSEGFTGCINHIEWVEAVCGVSPATLKKWTSHIKEKNYFNHHKMASYMKDFCAANLEASRYLPLAEMMTRIVFLVQGFGPNGERMPSLPSERPPIRDMMFVRTIHKQSNLPPKYAPVVIAARESHVCATNQPNTGGLTWSTMLFYVKLERKHRLLTKLQNRRHDTENMSTYEYDDVRAI